MPNLLQQLISDAKENQNKEIPSREVLSERLSELEAKVQKLELISKYNMLKEDWEESFVSDLISALAIYAFSALFLWILNIPDPLLNALVPPIGLFASRFSIPRIKNFWIKMKLKENREKEKNAELEKKENEKVTAENI